MATQKEALATVSVNDDPKKLGRIKVTCVDLLGDEQTTVPAWVNPALDWGWFVVPDVGQQVTIIYDEDMEDDAVIGQASIANANIRWKGSTEYTDDDAEDATPIPSEFTSKNYGKRRGMKTPRGHVFMFDDTEGDESVQLAWSGGNKSEPKTAFMSFNADGSYIMQAADGSMIYANAKDGEFSIIHAGGSFIGITEKGITLQDGNSNFINTSEAGVIINAGTVTVNASTANISAMRLKYTPPVPVPGVPPDASGKTPLNVGAVIESIAAFPAAPVNNAGPPILPVPTDGGASMLAVLKTAAILP